ncbi:unnamed protein product [Thelazia callipaeda]|uniref:DNA recombination/repair protein RecA n=1 Tax=Thelazia callipaeda TaxID=103827 RepID=A0A0N5CRB8_THECL|nr:unnamed protein product [Thelazia callipaeda]
MAMLEARAQKIAEEETGIAKSVMGGTGIRFVRGAGNVVESNVTENPEEIDIGDDDDDELDAQDDVETRAVPAGVLGSLAKEYDR